MIASPPAPGVVEVLVAPRRIFDALETQKAPA